MRYPSPTLVPWLAAGALIAAAAVAAAPVRPERVGQLRPAPAPAAVPVQRITADLGDLTLREAAAKVSQLAGIALIVPERDSASKSAGAQRLNFDRRAHLSWTDLPVSDALRDFCRKYDCSLARSFAGALNVNPGRLAG